MRERRGRAEKGRQACSIVILAAGEGSRMKSATPKVLHTICGRSMIARITESALQVSDDIHIILHHQEERIRAQVEKCFSRELSSITFHRQDRERFPGTGGALLDSRGEMIPLRHARTIVLNGDMPLIRPESIAEIARLSAAVVVSVLELADPSGYGRVVLDSQRVVKIIEQKDCDESQLALRLVNAGIYAFDTALLAAALPKLENHNAQKEYYLTDLIALLAQQDTLESRLDSHLDSRVLDIVPFYGRAREFIGVNSKLELAQAESIRLEELRERAMEQGVIMRMPESIYLEEDVEFVGECEIEGCVRLCGKSRIAHSHIRAGSVVEESVIEHSDIGPMAHIRPHSHISHTHIGNFVETKSALLTGVKAGHLSYLGDCEIGSGTNVGAGVITCNYDGKRKHRTIIGENVFIGSDSQLVAPVCIESHAMVGAGSTITSHVKSGELALSRVKQSNIAGFFSRFFGKG